MLYGESDKEKISAKGSKENMILLCKLLCDITQPHEYILRINEH
jgi:hypothetical protein